MMMARLLESVMGTPSIRSQIYNNANFLVTNTYPEPRQLRLDLAAEGRKHMTLPYLEPLEIFTYTMLQEKATQLALPQSQPFGQPLYVIAVAIQRAFCDKR